MSSVNQKLVRAVCVGRCDAVRVSVARGEPAILVVDGSFVYWLDNFERLEKASDSGGDAITLVSIMGAALALASDGRSLFWPEFANGAVVRYDLENGRVTTLVRELTQPAQIAFDETNVYFTHNPGDGQGSIQRVAKDGGPASSFTTAGIVSHIAVHAGYLYFQNGDRLARMRTVGGTIETLSSVPVLAPEDLDAGVGQATASADRGR